MSENASGQHEEVSEEFSLANSETAESNPLPATAGQGGPAGGVTTESGASTTTTTDPTRPVRPGIGTPAGLNAAREIMQRAVEITSRRANPQMGVAWANALSGNNAPSGTETATGGTAGTPDPGTTPIGGGGPDPVTKAPTVTTNAQVTNAPTLGTPSYGMGWSNPYLYQATSQAVPTWVQTPGYGRTSSPLTTAAPQQIRTAIASYGGYTLQDQPTVNIGFGMPLAGSGFAVPSSTPIAGTGYFAPGPTPIAQPTWPQQTVTGVPMAAVSAGSVAQAAGLGLPAPGPSRSAQQASPQVTSSGVPTTMASTGPAPSMTGTGAVATSPPSAWFPSVLGGAPGMTPQYPLGVVSPTPPSQVSASSGFGGMPSRIKNAVKMLQPFYSKNTTVDRARSFWNSFERATDGPDEQLRLNAFRECLKGKTGEDWWTYSRITDFETLRVRFYNQFICLTPLQMINRLKNTKRSRGMSAEVWGDVVRGLCDEAQCFDPQMRYQYFLSGLRNREWKAALSTAMVNSIPQAVAVLLYKNMHLPVEDDADFAAETPAKAPTENAMLAQVMMMLQQNQDMMLRQQQEMTKSPRSRGYVAAAYQDAVMMAPQPNVPVGMPTNVPETPLRGMRMGPDMYTQDGRTVCGRCHTLGCSRINCRRSRATCPNCHQKGHTGVECDTNQSNRNAGGGGQTQGQGRQSGGARACWTCQSTEHFAAQCPVTRSLQQMLAQGAQANQPAPSPAPAQQ